MKRLFSVLFCFIAGSLPAESYYVDQNHVSASNSNPGTYALPWLTLQHAAEMLQPGDSVLVRTGTYCAQVYTVRSGNPGEPIVFCAFPGEQPVIDGAPVSSGRTGLQISHSYIHVVGLDIRNWETAVWMEYGGFIEITECEVYQNVFGIAAANGAHDFVLTRVNIFQFDLFGFDASPSGGPDCYNGTFNDCIACTGRDHEQNVDGFALGHGTQHDFIFNHCTVYDVYDGFDISARNTTLNGCLSFGCWNGNYKIWQDSVKLVNCIGYGTPGANVELDWDGQAGTAWLINCTFHYAGTFTLWVENSADRLRMYNCIVAGGDNIGLAFEQMGVGNYQGDYNLFHNYNPDRAIAVGYTDEFTLDQLSSGAWTAYSGQDAHSLTVTSSAGLFVDPGTGNLRLAEGSPAVDHGSGLYAPTVDFEGKSRPWGEDFDIGAFEYQVETGLHSAGDRAVIPGPAHLHQNYPNPFNPVTTVPYTISKPGTVTLTVYNVLGKPVGQVTREHSLPGTYSIFFDANGLDAGPYFCQLKVGNQKIQTMKMVKVE